MKLKGFLLAASLLAGAQAFAQQHMKVVAIGFYNCENFFDPRRDSTKNDEDFTPSGAYHYTEDVYKQKLHNIASVFRQMGTDVTPDGPAIIGLAEVENDRVLQNVTQEPEIKSRNYQYVWFPTPDERGISTAMLYNPKYFTLLKAEPLTVPMETIGQKRPTRAILHVTGMLAGDTVHVLVNHWPSKSGGEAASAPGRRLAASIDKRIVDSLMAINPQTKVLIMGDLNDNPTSEGVVHVIGAKAEIKDVGMSDIYNPWINMYNKGMGTEIYQGEWNLIDQIMISGAFLKNPNDKWKYYKSEIFKKEFLTHKIGKDKGLPHRSFTISQVWDNGYSDHFPVVMYMVSK